MTDNDMNLLVTVSLSFLFMYHLMSNHSTASWYANSCHVTEKKCGFLPWQKFSTLKERTGRRRKDPRDLKARTKDDVRRININATVSFLHLLSAPFQSRWDGGIPTIEFSFFHLSSLPSHISQLCEILPRNSLGWFFSWKESIFWSI